MTAPYLTEGWANKLHVISVISNPRRFRTRYDLYERFATHMQDSGAVLWTVEMAFGERSFAITEAGNPQHIQVRSAHELWVKECLQTIGLARLPQDARYICFLDADVSFVRPDWANEVVEQLQHHPVVQPFSHALDVTGGYVPMVKHLGFAYCWWQHLWKCRKRCSPYTSCTCGHDPRHGHPWHPGFGLAWRRESLDAVGGLIDWSILGAGDNAIMKSLVGDGQYSYHKDVTPAYKESILTWERRALAHLKKDLGYVEGLLISHFHGPKKNRAYWDRWKILTTWQFNPQTDLKRDSSGLWQLVVESDRQIQLRDAIRRYFLSRREDETEPNPAEFNV